MRRRRKTITFIVVISAIVVVFIGIYIQGIFKDLSKDNNVVKNTATNQTNQDEKTKKQVEAPAKKEQKQEKSEGYAINLSNGKSVNAVYETKNGDKIFKELSPAGTNTVYSISPSGKNMIVYDEKVQGIILIDINGNKQDLSNMQYTASNGTVITRDAQISSQSNYVWCSSPKFIDENNIAYISQLPWLGKSTKYVWIETIANKNHVLVQGIEGEDVKLDKITDKGLTVISDGKTVYLTPDGSVSE
ncbi:hypothetical protein HBE96_11035 [Clostridium sp. P21]|uniref:Uncharacterized protein n=2 Tax=Clostridium muellerianum TaxID=2716538 RepID=A0A7Y0EHJ1_9CLOT|nr:hypothetical protein [Clostridium muellerianum]NMM63222.1 hypothetical protein [Clostridium muellerianum]